MNLKVMEGREVEEKEREERNTSEFNLLDGVKADILNRKHSN